MKCFKKQYWENNSPHKNRLHRYFYPKIRKITYYIPSLEYARWFLDIKNRDLIWKLPFVLITREALQLMSRESIQFIYTSNQRFGEQFAKIALITWIAERRTFLARLQQVYIRVEHIATCAAVISPGSTNCWSWRSSFNYNLQEGDRI